MNQNETLTKAQINAKVKEIHNEFNAASEKAMVEAKSILEADTSKLVEKGDRLSKLGFGATKEARMAASDKSEKAQAKERMELIMKYHVAYPNNKFITEKQVEEICKKYGLIKGDSSRYTGFVPEKNLKQIEAFKLKKEDQIPLDTLDIEMERFAQRMIRGSWQFDRGIRAWIGDAEIPVPSRSKAETKPKIHFEICAPAKDFNTLNMTIEDGYRLQHIPDPIVLARVKGGYLIVTAWGDEASDENVVNEINN